MVPVDVEEEPEGGFLLFPPSIPTFLFHYGMESPLQMASSLFWLFWGSLVGIGISLSQPLFQ